MENVKTSKTELFANRYELQDEIGSGGMGVIYRAKDRLSGNLVALKQLPRASEFVLTTDVSDSASTKERIALAREFEILAALHHPHIIQVQDYGFWQGNPYFTMSLLENAQDIKSYAQNLSLTEKVELILQVLESLAYLHQRSILHHDIKPGNILVKDGHVYLLDFGLSIEQGLQHLHRVGTVTYLAPEIVLHKASSGASDLYSLGVVFYELLTGKGPYQARRRAEVMDEIVTGTPDFSIISELEYEQSPIFENRQFLSPLAKIIKQMLAKQPEDRYADAQAVIYALNEVLQRPVPSESEAIRESYLQFADFVGRTQEYTQLTDALLTSFNGEGSFWLIGGESGVGKSRLVSEVKRVAKVWGALVLQGNGEQFNSLPYQYWREPLRRLLLTYNIDPLDASILKTIVPDIEQLLEYPVETLEALANNQEDQRLIFTISDLFSRLDSPVVLILEDLHWAVESLKVLQAVIGQVSQLPLLILATYQPHIRPDLPEVLPNSHVMHLECFTDTEISELTGAILGQNNRNPQIINFLAQETEGNAFFMVETLRALAEESGTLRQIAHTALPPNLTTSGIRAAIMSRLMRYPADFRSLLILAALAGRQLDIDLLWHIVQSKPAYAQEYPTYNSFTNWLNKSANASILRIANESWQFTHDKLREVVLDALDETQRRSLHEMIAQGYEAVYPQDTDYVETLFYHWQGAQNENKIVQYALSASRQMYRLGEHHETIRYAQAGLASLAENNHQQRAEFSEVIGRAYVSIGDINEAEHYLKESINRAQKAGDLYLEAQANITLGWMYNELSNQKDEAQNVLEKTLAIAVDLKDEELKADALIQYGTFWFQTKQFDKCLEPITEAINIYTSFDNPSGLGRAYNLMALYALGTRDFSQAQEYFLKCQEKAEQFGERWLSAAASNNLSIVYYELNDLAKAEEFGEKTLAIYRRLNTPWRIMLITRILTYIAFKQQNLDLVKSYLEETLKVSINLQNEMRIASNLCLVARYHMKLQQYEQACHIIGLCIDFPDLSGQSRNECEQMLDEIGDWLDEDEIAMLLDEHKDRDVTIYAQEILVQLQSE